MTRKPYIQKQPADWWLKNPFYRFYMLREATAVPVLIYALLLLDGLFALADGPQAFADWQAWMATPLLVLIQLLALAAAVLHALTWFRLTPKILVIRIGDRPLAPKLVELAHYGAFALLTLAIPFIVWLALKG